MSLTGEPVEDCLARYILLLMLSSVSVGAETAAHRVTNPEYKFSVIFPGRSFVCKHMSSDQPHGFYISSLMIQSIAAIRKST